MEPEAEKPGTARAATAASHPPGRVLLRRPGAVPPGRALTRSLKARAKRQRRRSLRTNAGERRPLGGDGSQRQSAEAGPRGNSLGPDLPPAAGLAHVRRSAAQTTPWGGARLTHPRSREDAPPPGAWDLKKPETAFLVVNCA